ncbi:MAG: hypothetical protein Ct9H90mP6_03340 [Gammaproteobacteria bacterium]|nr:MAG: hypothetical protein Ct9H90mP6_03340 [Gammaproteobacteria bacterium]
MKDVWYWEEIKPQVHRVFRDCSPDQEGPILQIKILYSSSEGRLVNLGNATGHPSRIMEAPLPKQVLAQMHLYEKSFAKINDEEKKKAFKKG